jgi:anion-transporting  ArsA/GET3 family ATPase
MAMALAWAQAGDRVLLMQLGARDRLGAAWGREPLGAEIVPLCSNVWAVNASGRDAMREYARMMLRIRAVYRAVFENERIDRFLRIIPGLPELTLLGKAYYHEKETVPGGTPRWDRVIVDAPATGHGIFLLQIPQVIRSVLGSGHMAEEAGHMLRLLEDPSRACVNLITLAEEMPVAETIELHRTLQRHFSIRVGGVFVNQVWPRLLARHERPQVQQWSRAEGLPPDLHHALHTALFREHRCDLQARALDRLNQAVDEPTVQVPWMPETDPGVPLFERLAGHLAPGLRPVSLRGTP